MEELNSGPPNTNPSSGREEDLNQVPLDYKSSALTTGPHCLHFLHGRCPGGGGGGGGGGGSKCTLSEPEKLDKYRTLLESVTSSNHRKQKEADMVFLSFLV